MRRTIIGAALALATAAALAGMPTASAAAPSALRTAWASPANQLLGAPGAATRCTFSIRTHASATGVALRLRNDAADDVVLTGLTVATSANPARAVPLTVGRRLVFTLPAGAAVTTDVAPLAMATTDALVATFTDLSGDVAPTAHSVGLEAGSCRDLDGGHAVTEDAPWFADAVLVQGSVAQCDVAVLGDSISDGLTLPVAQDARWLDRLAAGSDGRVLVANASVSGNRLLDDTHGPGGVARVGSDALDLTGVDRLVVEEGTNDLAAGRSAARVLAAYRDIARIAHARGVPVLIATVAPRAGSAGWTSKKEAQRRRLNLAVRTASGFDGVIDLDAAVRGGHGALRAGYGDDDHLHLTVEGQDAVYRSAGVQRLSSCA
ncbi:MAG TPA: GDSL-type esterase/lipase family protein [Mycobacteriales bacterium]|nr:GDSL-type esterase/lipase family protein [Mycobacteriales bacterium]